MKTEALEVRNHLVDFIMEYEDGELSDEGFLKLFSFLIETGQAWSLQGHYGRTAHALIDRGVIDHKGNINWSVIEDGE